MRLITLILFFVFAVSSKAAVIYYNLTGEINLVADSNNLLGTRDIKEGDIFQAIYTIETTSPTSAASNATGTAHLNYSQAILNYQFIANGIELVNSSYGLQFLQFANGYANGQAVDYLYSELNLSEGQDASGYGLNGLGEWVRSTLNLTDTDAKVFNYIEDAGPSFENLIPLSLDVSDFENTYTQVDIYQQNSIGAPAIQLRGTVTGIGNTNAIVDVTSVNEPSTILLLLSSLLGLSRGRSARVIV